ncbi:hypothetical protein CDD81_7224 [Ophiocordyceps australis]|uniref:Uncharacterized protein n=1 Tax=Ophiocordyceps australis TaxID=1399860 RepID=A0A2C5Y550_9HYPO|nr:hypothetical protein CDD81_7224 [Ophiocordyceps australis]
MDDSCPRSSEAPEMLSSLAAYNDDTSAVPSCPPLSHDAVGAPTSAAASLLEPGRVGGAFLDFAGGQLPMELLVGRLEKQSLDMAMRQSEEGSCSQPLGLREADLDDKLQAMDVDMEEPGEVETALPMLPHRLEAMRLRKRYSCSQASRSARAVGPPIARAEQSSAQHRRASNTESKAPLEAPDPSSSMCGKLEADEGYCEGADDMSWLDGDEVMAGLSSTARSNGLLKFQTSAERAMQCSMVVRKAARMRRRRHQKRETRMRPSETETATAVASTAMYNGREPGQAQSWQS